MTYLLQWRHNERDGVSNHRRLNRLLNRLFRGRSKKTSKLRVTGFGRGIHRWPMDSPHKGTVTRENVAIWLRHYVADVLQARSEFCFHSCIERVKYFNNFLRSLLLFNRGSKGYEIFDSKGNHERKRTCLLQSGSAVIIVSVDGLAALDGKMLARWWPSYGAKSFCVCAQPTRYDVTMWRVEFFIFVKSIIWRTHTKSSKNFMLVKNLNGVCRTKID